MRKGDWRVGSLSCSQIDRCVWSLACLAVCGGRTLGLGGFLDGSAGVQESPHDASAADTGDVQSDSAGSRGAVAACTQESAQGAIGENAPLSGCSTLLGWAWDGSKCIPVVGCICEGSDCSNLSGDLSTCSAAHAHCFSD
jgi:hypothetical protein